MPEYSTEIHLKVMRLLAENPNLSQRALARELGISLGGLNYCLRALVEKGWVKVENFSKSPRKLGYSYLLTPSGIAAKARLTARFLQRKIAEYEALKTEIEALREETKRDSASDAEL